MKPISIPILLGALLLGSCAHQRPATLRVDQLYDIPCAPYHARIRTGDDGVISFTYTISSTEILEVQCKGRATSVGQVVPTSDGRVHHVTAYDGNEWEMNSVAFTNQAKRNEIPNHGLESTSAPPAAGTPETHP